jgi:hypothetical protein
MSGMMLNYTIATHTHTQSNKSNFTNYWNALNHKIEKLLDLPFPCRPPGAWPVAEPKADSADSAAASARPGSSSTPSAGSSRQRCRPPAEAARPSAAEEEAAPPARCLTENKQPGTQFKSGKPLLKTQDDSGKPLHSLEQAT